MNIATRYTVYHADGTEQAGEVDWPEQPTLVQLKDLIEPIVGAPMEHVTVLYGEDDGSYRDMFVDELSHIRPGGAKPRNEKATAIYRRNWLTYHGGPPEELPWIAGTAIVFDRVVWS